ncbi:MAG TPA: acetate kinase [Bacillota bacterium]|nr:acetate kinase [Bacillota bacterium]HOH10281.1 acetate kinase [Bacillota bacterium]HPI02140.1 acetate kinase [Bacillota bacterium]HPM63904.1 acetate kinase [Bacillota bacterium]HQJ25106.1 acetate kinase [Bacillota bacterium]
MKILVVNCGSSSVKYQLFDMTDESVLAKGIVERVGSEEAFIKHQPTGKAKMQTKVEARNHEEALRAVFDSLLDSDHGVIKDIGEISAVGHRVVHAGEKFSGSVPITKEVIDALIECQDLAPLHNPPNIMGIRACQTLMPDVPMVGVFDTAFHQTMPKEAYLYGLPYELYERHRIRRYGFHGTSHRYVSARAAEMLKKPYEKTSVITCHLGNGSSIAAIKNGKSIDTTMGLTPLEGLVMGTRVGDLDPGIVLVLCEKLGLSVQEVVNGYLNKKSGVFGLSNYLSNDFRDLEEAASKGNEYAKLALDVFAYRIVKYIGAYAVAMGELDAIVFTGGIGENSFEMRKRVCDRLTFLGIKINDAANMIKGKEVDLTTPESRIKVLAIPTNEELVIARDTKEIVTRG